MSENGEGGPSGPSGPVGYRRPPARREGEIRNPWGRNGKPKPKPDFLDGEIEIQVNGVASRVTRNEALDHFLFARASKKGDPQAIRRLEERQSRRLRDATAGQGDELGPDEQALLESYLRREARKLRDGGT